MCTLKCLAFAIFMSIAYRQVPEPLAKKQLICIGLQLRENVGSNSRLLLVTRMCDAVRANIETVDLDRAQCKLILRTDDVFAL
jgi:hypothetical protein